MTAAVLPMNMLISYAMLHRQRIVFRQTGLRIRRNYTGFLCYMLLYAPRVSCTSRSVSSAQPQERVMPDPPWP